MQINNVSMQNFGLKVTDRAEKILASKGSLGDIITLARLKHRYSDNITLDIREPLPTTRKKFKRKFPLIISLKWKDTKPKIFSTYKYTSIDFEKHVEDFLTQIK